MNKVFESEYEGHYSGIISGVSSKFDSFGHGAETCSFGITYEVMMEIDHTSIKKYHSIKRDGSLGYEREKRMREQVMDWTEDREQFFENLYNSMRLMVLQISKFIDMDSDNASLLIDSKVKLLQ